MSKHKHETNEERRSQYQNCGDPQFPKYYMHSIETTLALVFVVIQASQT